MSAPHRNPDRARYARYTVFAVMALYLAIGTGFALGEDLPDADAVVFAATWVVPAAALSVLAVLRPAWSEWVLLATLIGVAVFVMTGLVPAQTDGPEATIYGFGLGIPLAFLALRRAATAGWLLIGDGLALAVGVWVFDVAPPGSAMAVFVPLLIFGTLFRMTERLGGVPSRHAAPSKPRPSH